MLNWSLLGVSALILIGLSLYSMRAAGDKDESGFLVANNSLGPFVAAATLVATGYSGFVFIGSPGVAYEYGSLELFSNCKRPDDRLSRRSYPLLAARELIAQFIQEQRDGYQTA